MRDTQALETAALQGISALRKGARGAELVWALSYEVVGVKVDDQAAVAPGRNYTDQHRMFSLTLGSAFLCLLCSKQLPVSLKLQNLAQVLLTTAPQPDMEPCLA